MSPWDEVILAINLKVDVPQQVVQVLKILSISRTADSPSLDYTAYYENFIVPDHPFFQEYEEEWDNFLTDNPAYFPGDPFVRLTYDELEKCHRFTTRGLVRRGSFVIASFLHWLAPYSQTQGIVGYTRCDESSEFIALIYFENGTVYYREGDFSEGLPGMWRNTIAADGVITEETNLSADRESGAKPKRFERVVITHDLPDENLKQGDVVTLLDNIQHPHGGEEGCIIELFNAVGESIGVATVPISAIESRRADQMPAVRSLAASPPR